MENCVVVVLHIMGANTINEWQMLGSPEFSFHSGIASLRIMEEGPFRFLQVKGVSPILIETEDNYYAVLNRNQLEFLDVNSPDDSGDPFPSASQRSQDAQELIITPEWP